ncbi:unnamed protein product [Phytophthora fragariaefolia]|uniref:Unnamed protein product n=1 Tax=Phytophthora fragariaefolia TaxID=1490495 RepID=A0A9W6XUW2_9STRA|nr:unnamed protein product [Phytophthora fragariaefolia]
MAAGPGTATATAPADKPQNEHPIRGGDGRTQPTTRSMPDQVARERVDQRADESEKRREREPTLQLTDDEIIRAQTNSRLVQKLVEAGEYGGTTVMMTNGLAVISTANGQRVVLPPELCAVVFKEPHDSVWAGHLRAPHTHA